MRPVTSGRALVVCHDKLSSTVVGRWLFPDASMIRNKAASLSLAPSGSYLPLSERNRNRSFSPIALVRPKQRVDR